MSFERRPHGWARVGLLAGIALLLMTAELRPGSLEVEVVGPGAGAIDPLVTEQLYVVNARIRPLLLFWMGREDVGGGRITWRQNASGSRAIELLIGSDPARVPRRINRWGFIREESANGTTHVLGVMKESSEETLAEAEANIERDRTGISAFKAIRTTIAGNRAVGGTITIPAPATLTYRQLDALLAMIPPQAPEVRSLELPPGTQPGFLMAMTTLIRDSAAPCRLSRRTGTAAVPKVPYVYRQTIYDLSLESCQYVHALRTTQGTYGEVIDGHFKVKNRTTREDTEFRLAFGTSGAWNERPVRMVFRPRWWIELELLLDQRPSAASFP